MKRRLLATTGRCEKTFSPSCQEAKQRSAPENYSSPNEQCTPSQYAVVPFARVSQTIYRDEESDNVHSEILEGDGPGNVSAVTPIGSRTSTSILDDLLDLNVVNERAAGSLPHPSQLRRNKNANTRNGPRQKRRNVNVDEHRDHLKKKLISLYGEDAHSSSISSYRPVVQNRMNGRSPLLSRETNEETIGVCLEEVDQLIQPQRDTPWQASPTAKAFVQGSATRSMLHQEDNLRTYLSMPSTQVMKEPPCLAHVPITPPYEPYLALFDGPIPSTSSYESPFEKFGVTTPTTTRYVPHQPRPELIVPAQKSDGSSPEQAEDAIPEDDYYDATFMELFLNIKKPLDKWDSSTVMCPEGYFDNIPGNISNRVVPPHWTSFSLNKAASWSSYKSSLLVDDSEYQTTRVCPEWFSFEGEDVCGDNVNVPATSHAPKILWQEFENGKSRQQVGVMPRPRHQWTAEDKVVGQLLLAAKHHVSEP